MRRASRRKYHYFYKTICIITNCYYYGIHSTDNLDDDYVGSGKRLWYSINKYGRDNHKIEILEFFDTREKLVQKEIDIVNEYLLKDPMCMNLSLGGNGGSGAKFLTKEQLQKGGKNGYKKVKDKIYNSTWGNEIWVKNYKERWIKQTIKRNKINNGMCGKIHSNETKQQMRKTHQQNKHQQGEKNSQYGTRWITNGKENKKIKKEDIIPDGWKLGRKIN